MSTSIKKLFDELRSISVVVLHPPGEDRTILLDQLGRIGCRVKALWPYPPEPPADADVIFFHVEAEHGAPGLWRGGVCRAALIALVDYENPTVLKALLDANAQGVLTKPFRASGVLSTLILARSTHGYEERLQSKIRKLEDTLRARREIEKAIKILVERRGLSDAQAYEQMRRQATVKRIPVAEIAATIVSASSMLDGLGPINR